MFFKMEYHQHSSSVQDDAPSIPQKPNSSALFTGREHIIEGLKNHFAPQDQKDKQRKSFLLYGMGGIGKTQICLKFVEVMGDRYVCLIYWLFKSLRSISRFSHIFWIDASSEDTITLSLKGLCFHPDAEAAVSLSSVSSQSALAWISSLQSEWLLVFDNADGGPEIVEKFIPSGSRGNILVTSRNKSLGRVTTYENSLEVGQMLQNEAILLLLKASHLTGTSGNVYDLAQSIVNELCCLPLAVDQAGAAIEAGLCSIDSYLQNLSEHRMRLMNHSMFKGASQYNCTVYQTWDLSFYEIETRARRKTSSQDGEAAQAAILILQTVAFFHHENILEAIFKEASIHIRPGDYKDLEQKVKESITKLLQLGEGQSWNHIFFREGIRVLRSFSLIKEGPSSGIYAVHPLMHKWNRDRMSLSQKQIMYKVAKLLLVHSTPLDEATESFAFRRLLLVHIKANYQFQQENHVKNEFDELEYAKFSRVMRENCMWKDLEDLQYQLINTRRKKFGENHHSTLKSMARLAFIFSKQGKYQEAERLHMQVLNLNTKLLGPEHPHTLTSMKSLAQNFSAQERCVEAEGLQIQVLNLCTRLLGPEHEFTLTSMKDLASTFMKQGKCREAENLHIQVLNLNTKLLGPEHPHTLTDMDDLALTFSEQKKHKEAEKLQMQVLDLRRNLLGPEHPKTLISMTNLTHIFSRQGNFEKTEKWQMEILSQCTKLLGPEHPNTLISMENLAHTFSDQGKFEAAEKLGMQVLNLYTKLLGPEHPKTQRSMSYLTSTFVRQGKYKEAEKLQIQVLDLHTKLLGSEHPHTLISMNSLALVFSYQGKYKEAEELGLQVLNLCTELLGSEHPETLNSMANLASTFARQKNFGEAKKLQIQVLNLHSKLLGSEHQDTLTSLNHLVSTLSKQEKAEKAKRLHLHTQRSLPNLNKSKI